MRTTKKKPFKELKIEGDYSSFKDFFDENKSSIYLSIIDVFTNFKKTNKRKLTLLVSTKIDEIDWKTEFNFHRNESIVLKRDILPYFEEMENYEICDEIYKLHNDLTCKK